MADFPPQYRTATAEARPPDATRGTAPDAVHGIAPDAAPDTVRTKDWQLSLHVVEDADTTRVHAVLDADGTVLRSDALARRNPRDDPDPRVGDEFAVGRALVDLGHQLLRAGVHDATDPAEE
ncbi:dsRBD fold-containing protein [Kitasatospora sp. NPDC001539]|uniref:dsRBD fold-containing protein n=1 Tax=Kitasatospora sp. NPDC001539 TaxID=3154384 RepID=UPI00332C452D